MKSSINKYIAEISERNGIELLFAGVGNIKGIFCADIMDNVQKSEMHPFAFTGEHHIILNDNENAIHCFCEHLYNAIVSGQDFQYQPLIKISGANENQCILYFTNKVGIDFEENEHNGIKPYSNATSFESIAKEIKATRNSFSIIENLLDTTMQKTLYECINELEDIAKDNNNIIISCVTIPNKNCDLAEMTPILIKKQRYVSILKNGNNYLGDFCALSYGLPDTKNIKYKIENNAIVPSQIMANDRWHILLEKYAHKAININNLYHILFGALKGKFNIKSIGNIINEALDNGMLSRNGNKVVYTNSNCKRNPNKNKIAITAFSDRNKETQRKRIPFAYFGNTKFIFGKHTIKINGSILKCIVTNKVSIEFKSNAKQSKTPNANICIFAIGEKANDIILHTKTIASSYEYKGKINCFPIGTNISGHQFKSIFEEKTNKHRPDYVFIMDMQNMSFENESDMTIFADISSHAKTHGFACFANIENNKYMNDLCLNEEMICRNKHYGMGVYDLTTCTNGKHLRMSSTIAENGKIQKALFEDKQEAYLYNIFEDIIYFTDIKNIMHDNPEITQNDINKAIKRGIVETRKIGNEMEIKFVS